MKIPIVVIVGPTAVGKSDYAVKYAKKHNGEVISADSRQVYKGLDIGTGKITEKEMGGIPHHLLDVANPKKQFNVEQYKNLAQKSILDIHSRSKLPIICGGTGFYIDALIKNISYPNVPHDINLRKKLSNKSSEYLFSQLKKIDEKFVTFLNHSERHNKQRLVRYIEIAKALGKVPEIQKGKIPYNIKWIKLEMPIEKLTNRINERLQKRIADGMIEEVENLHKNGLSWKRMEALGLEYRYISRYLRALISKEEMVKQLQLEIRRYAKRQMLWFRKIK
jgi:tRNA dimethylallyltransferase